MTDSMNIFELPEFREHDRFDLPGEMERVTSGKGGEAIMIFTGEKALLYDCGMAYCGPETVENIKKATVYELADTEGMNEKIAESVAAYFAGEKK